ncbi:hypothetical protein ACFLQV_01445 [Calditrichota bacterium]
MRTLSERVSVLMAVLMLLFVLVHIVYGGQQVHTRLGANQWGRVVTTRTAFNPLSLNPLVWLDAEVAVELDAAGTPADSGDAVQYWRDGSLNGNDAAQAVVNNRPVFRTGVHNDKPVLTFGGVDDYLNGSGNTTAGEFTYVFAVASTDNDPGAHNGVFNHSAGSFEGSFALNWLADRPALVMGSNNVRYWDDFSGQDDGALHQYLVYISGSGQPDIATSELYFDGQLAAVNNTSSVSAAGAWDAFEIGRLNVGVDYYGDYDMALLGVFAGKLNANQQARLFKWIKQRKGTP